MTNVLIKHPDLPEHAPAVTSHEAFELLYEPKGWRLVDDEGNEIPDPEELRGHALDKALRDAGLPVTGTADDKRAALAAHTTAQGA